MRKEGSNYKVVAFMVTVKLVDNRLKSNDDPEIVVSFKTQNTIVERV